MSLLFRSSLATCTSTTRKAADHQGHCHVLVAYAADHGECHLSPFLVFGEGLHKRNINHKSTVYHKAQANSTFPTKG